MARRARPQHRALRRVSIGSWPFPASSEPEPLPARSWPAPSPCLAAVIDERPRQSAIAERATHARQDAPAGAADCPTSRLASDCQITGQVTGFQRAVDGKDNLFKAPTKGKIVAWSVDLAKPSKEEREVFGEAAWSTEFGKAPTAGISILRKRTNQQVRLAAEVPDRCRSRATRREPDLHARRPAEDHQGPDRRADDRTWLPAFAAIQGPPISRRTSGCNARAANARNGDALRLPAERPAEEQLEYYFAHTSPHRKVGSERKYGCSYTQRPAPVLGVLRTERIAAKGARAPLHTIGRDGGDRSSRS